MNRSITNVALAFGLALSATVASAAMDTTKLANGKSVYGALASASQAEKVVDVGSADTVTIDCGATVTFRSGDESFSWKFDVVGHRAVDLLAIAPAGFTSKPLKVYVVRNDSERN